MEGHHVGSTGSDQVNALLLCCCEQRKSGRVTQHMPLPTPSKHCHKYAAAVDHCLEQRVGRHRLQNGRSKVTALASLTLSRPARLPLHSIDFGTCGLQMRNLCNMQNKASFLGVKRIPPFVPQAINYLAGLWCAICRGTWTRAMSVSTLSWRDDSMLSGLVDGTWCLRQARRRPYWTPRPLAPAARCFWKVRMHRLDC